MKIEVQEKVIHIDKEVEGNGLFHKEDVNIN